MNPSRITDKRSTAWPIADENIPAESSRRIRSFVRRDGRITRAQQRAVAEWWERFGVETDQVELDPAQIFGRHAPLVLEIGFGDGESLVAMAEADPDTDYLGIEVHLPGIGHLLLRAAQLGLTNLRVLRADAVEVLEKRIPDRCLDRVQIFFPDPWPKARHHKRRLIQFPFISLVVRKLKASGRLHIATDCEEYADAILAVLNATPELINRAAGTGFAPRPAYRPQTKFELRGQRLGHPIRDLLFACRAGNE